MNTFLPTMAGQYTVHLKYLLQKIAQNNRQKN